MDVSAKWRGLKITPKKSIWATKNFSRFFPNIFRGKKKKPSRVISTKKKFQKWTFWAPVASSNMNIELIERAGGGSYIYIFSYLCLSVWLCVFLSACLSFHHAKTTGPKDCGWILEARRVLDRLCSDNASWRKTSFKKPTIMNSPFLKTFLILFK